MSRIPLGPLHYEFSRHNEPRLRIEPGETIVVETEDALSGQIRDEGRPPRQGQDALQQPADRPDLGRGGRAGRRPGRDDRRDPPDHRPVLPPGPPTRSSSANGWGPTARTARTSARSATA